MRWLLVFALAASCLAVSATAAYFSIIGLAQLFAAAAMPVIIMGVVLENAKVATTAWLHIYWDTAPHKLKWPLAAMVIALMAITSIGIFGFLSAGHLEQSAPADAKRLSIERVDAQIATREAAIVRSEATLKQLDQSIEVFLKNDKATAGLDARRRQQAERQQLQTTLRDDRAELDRLQQERLVLRQGLGAVEAKLGPVKYLAKALGIEHDTEAAVLIVIAVLMFAFDPLAILLVIATVITVRSLARPKPAPAVVRAPVVRPVVQPAPAPVQAAPEPPPAVPVVQAPVEPEPAPESIPEPVQAIPEPPPARMPDEPINPPVDTEYVDPGQPLKVSFDFGRGRWRSLLTRSNP